MICCVIAQEEAVFCIRENPSHHISQQFPSNFDLVLMSVKPIISYTISTATNMSTPVVSKKLKFKGGECDSVVCSLVCLSDPLIHAPCRQEAEEEEIA